MMIEKTLGLSLKIITGVLLLSGCASSIFPDFADDTQVMIDEGGKVEVRKINNTGILVADKENAVYEDEESGKDVFVQNKEVEEKVEAAKTVKVEAEELNPLEDKVVVAENEVSEVEDVKVEDEKNEEVAAKVEDEKENDVVDNGPTMHYLAETIYFDNGSSVVDYKFYDELRAVAKVAKKNNAMVIVHGYASSRTRNTDPVSHKLANFKVSSDRANSVVKILLKQGVKPNRIIAQALSDSSPVYQEVMPEGERLNRRVEIYLTY